MKKSHNDDGCTWRDQHGLSGARHRAYAALLRAHAMVIGQVEERAQREGALPLEWYDLLLALERAAEGRLRVGDLACHVVLSRSGLTRLVDKLEAAELVQRRLNPQDRRSFEIILQPKGRAERERTWPIYARLIAEVFGAHYTNEEAELLANLLERQVTGAAGMCDGRENQDE